MNPQSRGARWVSGVWVPYLLALLFFVGGFYKAVDPDDAITAVNKLGASSRSATAIVLIMAVIEFYFGINLLGPNGRVRFVKYSVVLLGVFTVFLAVLKSGGGSTCGCTGVEPFLAPFVNPIAFGIGRNIALIVCAEWYIWRSGSERSGQGAAAGGWPRQAHHPLGRV